MPWCWAVTGSLWIPFHHHAPTGSSVDEFYSAVSVLEGEVLNSYLCDVPWTVPLDGGQHLGQGVGIPFAAFLSVIKSSCEPQLVKNISDLFYANLLGNQRTQIVKKMSLFILLYFIEPVFLVHNLLRQTHRANLSVSIEAAKYWVPWQVLTFNEREDELQYQNCLEFVILCSNRWFKIEVTARQKSVFPRCRLRKSVTRREVRYLVGQWNTRAHVIHSTVEPHYFEVPRDVKISSK